VKIDKCEEYLQESDRKIFKKYKCNITVEYNINDIVYEKEMRIDSDIKYNKGDIVDIFYDIYDPYNISIYTGSKNQSMIIFFISIFMFIFSVYGFNYCLKNDCSSLGAIFYFFKR